MARQGEKPTRPSYILFYVLFSTDTWRILMGFLLAVLFTPHILPDDLSTAGRAMLYVMVACIGWSITGAPARWITNRLKRAILGRTPPG